MVTERSPSGKYELVIEAVPRSSGWGYSRGTIAAGEQTIAVVTRNFSAFPFLFVEGHKSGHDFLVCGSDYQGQTVVDLCCGARRDFLPLSAEAGHGFCWSEYQYNAHHDMLVVTGCYWACPYEYRFYDFADPMEGWPELPLGDETTWVEAGSEAPKIRKDGSVVCAETNDLNDEDEERVVARTTLSRDGNAMVIVDTWMDEGERLRRERVRLADEEWAAEVRAYKNESPIYARVMKRSEAPPLSAGTPRIGRCFDGWCPHAPYDDHRMILRVASRLDVGEDHFTVDVEWGMEIAPVKLVVYKNGKTHKVAWFSLSVEGVDEAFDEAMTHLRPSSP